MGLFVEWAMMQFDGLPREAVEARFGNEGLRGEVEVDGWLFAQTKGHDPDALVERLARVGPEPAIAGWVYDSDLAYLAGVGRDRRRFSLLVGTPYTDSAAADEAATSLIRLASGEGRVSSAAELAEWSDSNAPKPISAGDALKALETDWTFAEEGLAEIFRRLGLPDLDRTFAALSTPTAEAGVVVSLPVHNLAGLAAFSLLQRLDRFGRPQAIAHPSDARSLEIELPEASTDPNDLNELLGEVQEWVDDIGLDYVTIFAGGKAYTVERKAPRRIS